MSDITYSFVVARARNHVIGCNNRLPWKLPTDLKTFKRLTLGKPVIMGRLTFESIGRPLPGRSNIVISRDNGIHVPNVRVAKDKESAKRIAEEEARRLGVREVMVIGGDQIFKLFSEEVSKIYLTEVHAEVPGDAYFSLNLSGWRQERREEHPAGVDGDEYSYTFLVLTRPRQSSGAKRGTSKSERLMATA
jgi:dihydrofolate reductase